MLYVIPVVDSSNPANSARRGMVIWFAQRTMSHDTLRMPFAVSLTNKANPGHAMILNRYTSLPAM